MDEIIIPYVEKEREALNLDKNQPALLIIDVFSGQVTKLVIDKMTENNIKLVKVPSNMTRLFQPLDLTVNGSAKAYMKKRFTESYSRCIIQELDSGKGVDNLDIQLKISILKPPHANWINNLYQLFHSARRKGNYSQQLEGCIYHRSLLKKGKQGLDPLHPFA